MDSQPATVANEKPKRVRARRRKNATGFTQEFNAADTHIVTACYPVEQVTGFELKSRESEGWIPQSDVEYLLVRRVVVCLERPLGTRRQLARVIYTGGYVLPGSIPELGQTMLPTEIEHAALEQVAFWFQNRDRIGCTRVWDYHGTFRHFESAELAPSVKAILQNHRRLTL